ncbi:MAG TPA: TolC family protein [Pyrinomonadaceae bacterium]|nr:TolC family protein [Pyrinomonadaceae bacterium]
MYSPLIYNGHRREWLRLFTARRIVVVALVGLIAALAHTAALPKAAAQAGRQTAAPSPTPTPTQPVSDQEPLRVPSVAPNYEADKATYPQLALIGVSFDRQQTMTLREVVELALRNNKDIEVSRSVVRSAEATLMGAKGFYDPKLTFNRYFFREVQSVSSSTLGGDQGSVKISGSSGAVNFFGLSPKFGGQYQISYTDSQTKTNVIFATLDKQFKTNLTFSYTQPLLRNREIDEPRRQIEIAKKNLSLTDAQFRTNVIEIITVVRNSYWDLVYSLRNLQIQQDALHAAEEQLSHTRRLVGRGYVAPIDVTQIEAQVSNFREGLYLALQGVAKSDIGLKNLIVGDINDPLWNVLIIPTDPVDLKAPTISPDQAFDDALAQRPELQQSDVALAINELNQRFYKNQTRPQVDLVGSYSLDGLAGSVNPLSGQDPIEFASTDLTNRVNELSTIAGLPPLPPPVNTATVPPFLVGSYGQSLTNLFANRFPTVRFGIQVDIPIKNRQAEAQLALSREEGTQLKTRREQLDQLVKVDVRTTLQSVRTAEARLRASAEARTATEQQYESEVRLYNGGRSTTFLVLDRQMAVKNARGVELKAQMDLNKAISELDRAIGRTVKSFDFVLDIH